MVPMNVKCLETPMRKTWTFIQKSWELIRRQQPHSAQRHGLNCVLLRKSVIRSYPWLLLLQGNWFKRNVSGRSFFLLWKKRRLRDAATRYDQCFYLYQSECYRGSHGPLNDDCFEAKAAAVSHLLLGSCYSEEIATGSGTDGMVIASAMEESWHLPMPPDIPSLESWLAGQSVWQ